MELILLDVLLTGIQEEESVHTHPDANAAHGDRLLEDGVRAQCVVYRHAEPNGRLGRSEWFLQ